MTRRWLALLGLALPACGGEPGSSLGGPFFVVTQIAVNDDGVFVAGEPDGNTWNEALARLPLAGGATTTLVPTSAEVGAFAVDATNAYVFDENGIERVPQAGGAAVTLASEVGWGTDLTVSGGALVWLDIDNGLMGTIWTLPVQGGTPAALTRELPQPCALAADGANVYWIDCTTDELASLPLDADPAASPKVLATGLSVPQGEYVSAPLAVAGGSVLWGESGTGAIRKVASAGGPPVTLAANAGHVPSQIVTDGTEVYWSSVDWTGAPPSSVWSVAASGGTPTQVLSPDQNGGAGYGPLALDASYLYFEDDHDGSIRRVPR